MEVKFDEKDEELVVAPYPENKPLDVLGIVDDKVTK